MMEKKAHVELWFSRYCWGCEGPLYRLIRSVILMVVASIVFAMFVRTNINNYEIATLPDMVYGQAHKPYVYRVLVPVSVRLIASCLPENAHSFLSKIPVENAAVRTLFAKLRWNSEYAAEYFITLIILYLSLLGFAVVMKYLFTGLFDAPKVCADLVSVFALVGLPPFFRYCNYMYDLTALLLFASGLALMARRRWGWFLTVFCVSCFNKETTILLTMVFMLYPAYRKEAGWKFFTKMIVLQMLIVLVVKAVLFLVFKSNHGSFVEFHLLDYNASLILKQYHALALFLWIGLILLVFQGWHDKPLFLRRGIWIMVPLLFFTLLFGYLDELRDYYEAYPIVFLLIFATVANILGIRCYNKEAMHANLSQMSYHVTGQAGDINVLEA